MTQSSGIKDLFPGASVEALAFEPCGYSCNGHVGGEGYFTIHVTPEEACSYASFETNVALGDYSGLQNAVLEGWNCMFFFVALINIHIMITCLL